MKFDTLSLDEAEGTILAHGLRLKKHKLAKGHILQGDDIADLRAAGFIDVVAARLEAGDIGEDEAAQCAAEAIAGPNLDVAAPFAGRCNIYSAADGLLRVNRSRIDALNAIDEAVTVATVRPDEPVNVGQLVATVKVIPLGLERASIKGWIAATPKTSSPISVAPFHDHAIGLLLSNLPGAKATVLEKTVRTLSARVNDLGSHIAEERRCEHTEEAIATALAELAAAGCDPIVVFGASAVIDRRDVIPSAIERADGTIIRLGMPVDPGNLMLLARYGPARVLGVPGSARSPRLSGFDFVLWRLLAGIDIESTDISAMGVGGLLKDIPSRPYPREAHKRRKNNIGTRVSAMVLAAGQSRRMGTINKLLAEIDGAPMVQRVVDAIARSRVDSTLVVTGHQSADVQTALLGRDVAFIDNPDFEEGLSASVRAGIASLGDDIDGVLICLGDMPRIKHDHIDQLIESFNPAEGRSICVPTSRGKRGNPVLFDRAFFPDLATLAGDVGARHLIGNNGDQVYEVEVADDSIFVDVDTPKALAEINEIAVPGHAV